MNDLILIPYNSGDEGDLSIQKLNGLQDHPLVADVPESFNMNCGWTKGSVRTFESFPAKEVMRFANSTDTAVAIRDFELGRVVDIGITLNYLNYVCANDPNIGKIIFNALSM